MGGQLQIVVMKACIGVRIYFTQLGHGIDLFICTSANLSSHVMVAKEK